MPTSPQQGRVGWFLGGYGTWMGVDEKVTSFGKWDVTQGFMKGNKLILSIEKEGIEMRELKRRFDDLIRQSVQYQAHLLDGDVYYDEEYLSTLRNTLSERGLIEKFQSELKRKKGHKKCNMASVASSARLCFLYFKADSDIEFEKKVSTGLRGNPPNLDAYSSDNQTYYECKCHEIFDNHNTKKGRLRLSYRPLIKKYFNKYITRDDGESLLVDLKDLGIDDERTIYQLRFNLKQMLCHLFGLANNSGGTLQYVFFQAKQTFIDQDPDIKKVYEELHNEINKIWSNPVLQKFCDKHDLHLPEPKFVSVNEIEDIFSKKLN